ncbi:aminotransferase class III-fold pyridoxal phosphate-dependent enzyme [Pseudoxanthomonas mexicana]|uniref:aminotransferase class III-fold pyridoxal phosphate-dependent enzyme n=1 Tax=Pseudoxanthomonas mexicana TaxID=128785 RepID=UPI00398B6077
MGKVDQLRVQRIVERLRAVAADLSGHAPADLVENATFLDLGFDSLFLTQLASAFQGEYGVRITFRQLFDELPTIRALAEHLDRQLPPDAPVETAAETPAAAAAAVAAPVAVAIAGSAAPAERQAPPEIPTQPPVAAMPPPAGEGLQGVMAQQLALMSQQIQLLQSLRGGAAAAPSASVSAAAPVAQKPAASADAKPAAVPAAASAATAPAAKPEMPKGFGPQVSREERVLTRRQREHIQRLTARYNAKTMGSKLSTQAHRPHHADPRTAAGFNRLWKEMVYPIVIDRSTGCHLQDIDGNKYIDILNGFGPNFLGHSPPFVSEALKAQIDRGIEVGPQTPLAGEAAKLFCELTSMDRVSWVNTGSEAVQAAIRLARTYTGRNKIVVFSGDYHGNFDEVLVRVTKTADGRRTFPLAPGIPFRAVEDVLVLDYGEEESLDIIRKHAGEIAAVLVEPVQSRRPDFQPREFLHALRALTEQEEILLVFDEVITGFRICPGGAQEYYGVEADLATYGKIIGGGMPIGVVAGRARFMDTFDGGQWQYGDDSFPAAGVTFFAGTFVRHPLAIAAVHATLQYLKAQGPALQEAVNRRTTRLTTELNQFFKERGLRIHIPHFASQMFIRVQEEGELATLLFYHLRDRGIHVLENFPSYMTAAHTDEDVDRIIAAFKDSVLEMQADGILPRPAGEQGQPPAWRHSLPLTAGQREVWFASQMDDMASCAFNESDSVRIEGPLDAGRFIAAVEAALGEQEAFRYRIDEDGARQWVDEQARFEVPLADLSHLAEDERAAHVEALLERQALTPFDLQRGPLVRAQLFRLAADSHLFVIYCHHIVFDGYSSEILMRRIAEIYGSGGQADSEAATAVPYSVYAWRMASTADAASADAALDYWRSVYADLPAPLDLPTDRPRKPVRSYRGATLHRALDAGLSRSLRDTAKSLRTSLNVVLLSAFQTLLSRLTTQEDIVLGVPVAGQARTGLETVGYCVNALPLRAAVEHDKPFSQLAGETQRNLFDAFERQEASLGAIVNALEIPRDPSLLPLVEVIFNYSGYFSRLELPGCKVETHENARRAIYFDMFFNIIESDGRLVIDWDYGSDLFDEQTIARWADHYIELLKGVAADAAQAVGDLPLMSEAQQATAVAGWGRR